VRNHPYAAARSDASQSCVEQWLDSYRPTWDHVDRRGVRQLAGETWRIADRRDEVGQTLFRVFTFDHWLDVCQIETSWSDPTCR